MMSGHVHLGQQHQHVSTHSQHSDNIDSSLIDEHYHAPEFHLFHVHADEVISEYDLLPANNFKLHVKNKKSPNKSSSSPLDKWLLAAHADRSLTDNFAYIKAESPVSKRFHSFWNVRPPARAPPLA